MRTVFSTLALVAIVSSAFCSPREGSPPTPPGESTAGAVPDAETAGDVKALDLSDTNKVRRQLDAMSADEVARYLTDPKDPQFGWALAALRNKGEAAIPHLAKLMGRSDLGFGWMAPPLALLQIGDKGLPSLIALLKSDNPTARQRAAWALARRKKPCKDAIAPLIEVLKGKDESAAGYAASALAPNGKDAAAALVAIGASAKAAVGGLIKDLESGRVMLLATTDLRYACRAAEVLALIPEALPALIEGLSSDKEIVRIGCAWAMPTDKATLRQVVPKLKGLLARSTSDREQELVVAKLYQLDPDWVRRAAGGPKTRTPWRPRHWHNVIKKVVAAAKAAE